jgi:hypothetical protein
LKLGKGSVFDGIPNECLRHLPRRPLVHLTHLIAVFICHFPASWKEEKIITQQGPKFGSNLLLAYASTVINGFRTHDHIFILSKTIYMF